MVESGPQGWTRFCCQTCPYVHPMEPSDKITRKVRICASYAVLAPLLGANMINRLDSRCRPATTLSVTHPMTWDVVADGTYLSL